MKKTKLLNVLCEEQSIDIISWLPHGRSFIVYDKKKFVESILPRFFKESKFTSFTRKLNRWGFTRISRGVETGAYHHEVSVFVLLLFSIFQSMKLNLSVYILF